MTGAERGFLLLTCPMGDPRRRVLTCAQLRTLAHRAAGLVWEDRPVTPEDIVRLGYSREMAERITNLLSEEERLAHYLRLGKKQGCIPISRKSQAYPALLTARLEWDAPGCLWAKGEMSLLTSMGISLVGSRELRQENRGFARAVGSFAAEQGLVLISGNARGADREAQDACLSAGGRVICIVADSLTDKVPHDRILYLSEDSFDAAFSARRALSRNRCIHALGSIVFVAQAEQGKGGTWSGTTQNLRYGWSPVCCFRDGSQAVRELEARGAGTVSIDELEIYRIPEEEKPFI